MAGALTIAGCVVLVIVVLRSWYERPSLPRDVKPPPPREDALEDAPPRVPLPKIGTWVMVCGRRGCVIGDGDWVYEPVTYWRPCVVVLFDTGREKFTPEEWRAMVQAEPPAVVG